MPSSLGLAAFLGAFSASAQVPAPNPGAPAEAAPAPAAPAAQPAPPPLAPPTSAPSTPAAAAPPLDPPPPAEAPRRPSFLRTEEEVRAAEARRSERERPRRAPLNEGASVTERKRGDAKALPDDYVLQSSPWVDFTLTSFWMNERVGNFLNLGTQFGGYFFDRLRLSARLVVPLEAVQDDFSVYDSYDPLPTGSGGFSPVDSPNVTLLYSGSVGMILSNTKTFVFAPSVALQRTDVNDYGTSVYFLLPFEWTTRRNLRVGFELGLGHAFGGKVVRACYVGATMSCGQDEIDRPSGSAFLLQYYMGWALGRL